MIRQPLWAINSSLLFLFLFSQALLFVIKKPVPRRFSLEVDQLKMPDKKIGIIVEGKKIYGVSDLFATYIPSALPGILKPSEYDIVAIPEAPQVIPFSIPAQVLPVFVAPLPVALKGIVYVHNEPSKCIAIIQFQDSKIESNYKIGEMVNDAQILKIFANRVLVIRSNGQQEILYLREADAGKDLELELEKEISNMSILIKDGVYQIPLAQFSRQVKTLGQFIDLLDLTTVYHQGKSIGCRVGRAAKGSLGAKLGFIHDDIVQKIDHEVITDIASRVKVFDQISQKNIGDMIMVDVLRGSNILTLSYKLVEQDRKNKVLPSEPVHAVKEKTSKALHEQTFDDLEQKRKRILEQKVKMAPTARQIEMDERRKIMDLRRRNLLTNQHNAQVFGNNNPNFNVGRSNIFGPNMIRP